MMAGGRQRGWIVIVGKNGPVRKAQQRGEDVGDNVVELDSKRISPP